MANKKTYKIAGQSAPNADTNTVLYTVPVATEFVESTLTICNRNQNSADAFSIAVVKAGETLGDKHYLDFNKPVDARDSKEKTIGFTLSAGDSVVVWSSSGNLSFSLFGVELS